MSKIEEDLSIAAAAAWQMKDLHTTADTRNTLLKSSILEILFSALSIISQVIVAQCSQWELLDTSVVMAYTDLAMHMSLQNVDKTSGNKDNNLQHDSIPPMVSSCTCLTTLTDKHGFACS